MRNELLFLALILLLIAPSFAFLAQKRLTLADLINRKNSTYKTDIFGRQIRTSLQEKGSGITDGQQTQILSLMKQANNLYSQDLSSNARFIGTKVEDSFSGRWNVEIFGGDPTWGRWTHISQEKWLLFFNWGDFRLDYIIWVPEC